METKTRVTITLSKELKEYYEELGKKMGIAQSGVMALALQHYKDYRESMNKMGDIRTLLNQLDKMMPNKEGK